MASSNVQYYQRQKELQDSIMESEQRRKTLEAQLQAYCQSDQKLAKIRAVKLQNYWKKVCEDEKRSKQRNSQLLRDLDRIEANMASLEARREKLKYMKQQYFDHIERTYPQWKELVMQKKMEQQQQQQQQQLQQQQYDQMQQQHAYQAQQALSQQLAQQQQQQQQQQQYQQKSYQQQQQQQQKHQQQKQQPHQSAQIVMQQQGMYNNELSDAEDEGDEDEDVAPPLPNHGPPPPTAFNGTVDLIPEREYTNLKDVHRTPQAAPTSPPAVASVTVHMPKVGGESLSQAKMFGAMSGDKDNSFSLSEEVHIQPIQSVTVRQKHDAPRKVVATMPTGSDEDISDLEEDASAAVHSKGRKPGNQGVHSSSPPSLGQEHEEEEENEDDEEEDMAPVVVHPEITSAGMVRLLQCVEKELSNSLAVEGYYRARNPDPATRKDIIFKANNGGALASLDGEQVSMVVLEQLTPLVRRLPGACLLSDILLQGNTSSLTETSIRENLHRDSLSLWDKLMEHFVCLVKNNVLGTRELAFVFVPCLVHDNSRMQDKAVQVLEQVVEGLVLGRDGAMSPIPDSLNTARSSQQGGVPPLKFGSLVDSKHFTDEESSMITQSMNTDTNNRLPLNETDAYKNLVSGNQAAQRLVPNHHDDDTDNSDNDLEKQFVSTLSPRSHASKRLPDSVNALHFSKASVDREDSDQSHDLSHDHEVVSEVSSPLSSPVYVPTGVRPTTSRAEPSTIKSVLGSTGGSSQQRKIVGIVNSDLDSDTEVDLRHIGNKKQDDDDDFYDFYG